MRRLLTGAGILALLASATPATPVVVGGQDHCASVSSLNLIQNWVKVYVGGGVHTITLEETRTSVAAMRIPSRCVRVGAPISASLQGAATTMACPRSTLMPTA